MHELTPCITIVNYSKTITYQSQDKSIYWRVPQQI